MTFPIALDGVSVRYRVPLDRHRTLKEATVRPSRRRFLEHRALADVTLAVEAGETLGIVGRNGAGKTTLLNVMARVIQPTEGRLRVRGSVSPIIDLFAGFHPELTGRENVLLRGAFLGVGRAAMRARLDGIADFAGLGSFFDAPMRTYSAGMTLRLAFSIATSVEASILLIDEALGVGDAEFQIKCAARIAEHRARGVTFVVVSHDMVRLAALCDRVVWLDGGSVRRIGVPGAVTAEYAASVKG